MEKNKDFLGTQPVGKLLFKLAIPTVIAQLINMLYNIVDRIFIGHIPDAGSPVGIKQKGEYLSDEIGMYLACLYVCFTLGTSGITFVLTASSVFAPTGFLVFVATGA